MLPIDATKPWSASSRCEMINHPMSNDQANPNSATSTPPEAPLGTLADCPTFKIPEEYWGGLDLRPRPNVREASALPGSNVPESAPSRRDLQRPSHQVTVILRSYQVDALPRRELSWAHPGDAICPHPSFCYFSSSPVSGSRSPAPAWR